MEVNLYVLVLNLWVIVLLEANMTEHVDYSELTEELSCLNTDIALLNKRIRRKDKAIVHLVKGKTQAKKIKSGLELMAKEIGIAIFEIENKIKKVVVMRGRKKTVSVDQAFEAMKGFDQSQLQELYQKLKK